MNSSVTRTELLAFWYWIDLKPSPSIDMSKPASRSAAALSSSLALHQMNSRMSGWSTSSTTIFAARRVLPPDLIVPAHESAPRMNDTGPEAVPPFASGSIEPRMFDRLIPEPEPPLKIIPSFVFQSRIDSIVSSTVRMKQVWTATLLVRNSPDSVWMSYLHRQRAVGSGLVLADEPIGLQPSCECGLADCDAVDLVEQSAQRRPRRRQLLRAWGRTTFARCGCRCMRIPALSWSTRSHSRLRRDARQPP